MSTEALRELLAIFTIDVDSDKLKEADESIKDFIGGAKEAGKALLEAFAVKEVYEFVQSQVEAATQLERTALIMGTSVAELQALNLAAAQAGVSSDTLSTAMRFLNRNMAEGSEKRKEFAALGISLTDASGAARPAAEVIGDLADHIAETEDPAKRVKTAIDLLGRSGVQLIPLLERGHEAFDESRKSLDALGGGISEALVAKSKEAEASTARLSVVFRSLKADIALELIPGLRWLTEGLTGFVREVVEVERKSHIFRDLLQLGAIGLATVGVLKLASAFRALAAGELAAMALNPVAWVAVGLAAALLAYNDLKVALEGGKSVFGDVFGKTGIDNLKEGILYAKDAWDVLVGAFKGGWDVLVGIDETMKSWLYTLGALASKFSSKDSFFGKDGQLEHFQSLAAKSSATADDRFASAGDEVARAGSAILDRHESAQLAASYTGAAPGYGFAPPIYATAGAAPGGGWGGDPIIQNITNNYDTTVHAPPGGDPKAIGAAVGSALATGQQRANNNALQAVRKP